MKQFIIVCLLLIPNFIVKAQETMVQSINCKQFNELSQSVDKVLIVDIRELKYYKKGHVNNSVYGGKKDILKPLLDKTTKETPIFLYCEEGKRSMQAGEWVLKLGYKTVYQLEGGIREWNKQSYPLVKN